MVVLLLFSTENFTLWKAGKPNRLSKWVISKTSSLTINGSTNINRFSCAIRHYPKTDTISIAEDAMDKRLLLSGSINLEVANFNCANQVMTKQLRKTLKSAEFPYLTITFLSIKEVPSINQKRDIKGWVELALAGVKKRFEIVYQFKMDGQRMLLTGNQAINFSDFKLLPPRAVGRLISVNDQLNVAFYLQMEAV